MVWLKSLQEEKGSFLQILCTGTKSVDNILTKIVVVDVLCFILFVFFYWCSHICDYEKSI